MTDRSVAPAPRRRASAARGPLPRLSRRTGGRGRLELIGLGTWLGGLLGLAALSLATRAREQQAPDATAWTIAIASGGVAAAATVLLTRRTWRRQGGRAVQRLGRRVWRTGRLPEDLPTRWAVLRDLERRERSFGSWAPTWILAVLWGVIAVDHLTTRPSALEALTWSAFGCSLLVPAVADLVDRRRRPRLRELIARLRRDPVAPTVALHL